ncbi:hypothetical protein PFISCL1PPCAC_28430 [Pristionchus fissidentatus]|uniref:Uncharacterized protein n=1 Tax=Pristionchus fissidentatus TaxID=1538716 RepID=A0AAV5X211_9BILA|nr:hypothetical protein PFISCL1PPCAC_28430 [Pristionchus fissidentatus]
MESSESKLAAPPLSHLPKKHRPTLTTTERSTSSLSPPHITIPSTSKRPMSSKKSSSISPSPFPSSTLSPSLFRRDTTLFRSFEKVSFHNGRPRWIPVRDEVLFKGKIIKSVRTRRDREEKKESVPVNTAHNHGMGEKVKIPSMEDESIEEGRMISVDQSRRKREIARRSSSPSVNRLVSKDGSTVVTTSNSDTDDILVVMQGTSPMTTSVFSNADRKMKKVYEEALDDVMDIFDQVGSNLVRDLPHCREGIQ